MKSKDDNWYQEKIQSIKKIKRKLNDLIVEPQMRKKIKQDLTREKRAAKRTVKNSLKKWIENEINETDENTRGI